MTLARYSPFTSGGKTRRGRLSKLMERFIEGSSRDRRSNARSPRRWQCSRPRLTRGVARQQLASGTVSRRDAHRNVDGEAAAVLPLPHRLRIIARQLPTAHEHAQQPPAHACSPRVRHVAALGIGVGGTLCMPPPAEATRSCGRGKAISYIFRTVVCDTYSRFLDKGHY